MCQHCKQVETLFFDEDDNSIIMRGYRDKQGYCLQKRMTFTKHKFETLPLIIWETWRYDKKQQCFWFRKTVTHCPKCGKRL